MDFCMNCGGKEITKGIRLKTSENHTVGPVRKAGILFNLLSGPVPTYCEICKACGTIVRLYVKDTEGEWIMEDV